MQPAEEGEGGETPGRCPDVGEVRRPVWVQGQEGRGLGLCQTVRYLTGAPGALLAAQRGQPEWWSVPVNPSRSPEA